MEEGADATSASRRRSRRNEGAKRASAGGSLPAFGFAGRGEGRARGKTGTRAVLRFSDTGRTHWEDPLKEKRSPANPDKGEEASAPRLRGTLAEAPWRRGRIRRRRNVPQKRPSLPLAWWLCPRCQAEVPQSPLHGRREPPVESSKCVICPRGETERPRTEGRRLDAGGSGASPPPKSTARKRGEKGREC